MLGVEEQSRKEEFTLNALSIEEARVKAEMAGINAEFEQYSGVELDMEKPEEQLKKELNEFERMMANIGSVNLRSLEIYDAVAKEYGILLEKKKVLIGERDVVVNMMTEIERNKKGLFMNTLNVINEEFKRIFSQLMTKGDSYLELENSEDPFAGGLHINVKLTGSKFLDIRGL